MTITIGQALIAVSVCVVLLIIVGIHLVRSGRKVYAVYCVHCWKYLRREVIVSYQKEPGQWAICPDCVRFYWQFHKSAPSLSDTAELSGEPTKPHSPDVPS